MAQSKLNKLYLYTLFVTTATHAVFPASSFAVPGGNNSIAVPLLPSAPSLHLIDGEEDEKMPTVRTSSQSQSQGLAGYQPRPQAERLALPTKPAATLDFEEDSPAHAPKNSLFARLGKVAKDRESHAAYSKLAKLISKQSYAGALADAQKLLSRQDVEILDDASREPLLLQAFSLNYGYASPIADLLLQDRRTNWASIASNSQRSAESLEKIRRSLLVQADIHLLSLSDASIEEIKKMFTLEDHIFFNYYHPKLKLLVTEYLKDQMTAAKLNEAFQKRMESTPGNLKSELVYQALKTSRGVHPELHAVALKHLNELETSTVLQDLRLKRTNPVEVYELLVSRGQVDPSVAIQFNQMGFLNLVAGENFEGLERLLDLPGIDPRLLGSPSVSNYSPLLDVCGSSTFPEKRLSYLKRLLKVPGIQKNASEPRASSPLSYAVAYGTPDMVKALVSDPEVFLNAGMLQSAKRPEIYAIIEAELERRKAQRQEPKEKAASEATVATLQTEVSQMRSDLAALTHQMAELNRTLHGMAAQQTELFKLVKLNNIAQASDSPRKSSSGSLDSKSSSVADTEQPGLTSASSSL